MSRFQLRDNMDMVFRSTDHQRNGAFSPDDPGDITVKLRFQCGVNRGGAIFRAENGVNIEFIEGDINDVRQLPQEPFDLIHSSFGLPFAQDPSALIKQLATSHLAPGGQILCSLAHPMSDGEWLELDGEEGMFFTDYFDLEPDIRYDEEDRPVVESKFYEMSTMAEWFISAGLKLTAIREPRILPKPAVPPYTGESWEELRDQFRRIPLVAIFQAVKSI